MIIDWTYGTIICSIIFLAVVVLLCYLVTKKIPKFVDIPLVAGFLSVIPSLVICSPLYELYKNPLHIVDEYCQGKTFMLIGTADCDLGNGKTGKVSFQWGKSHIVNQSDQTLFVDVVHYGGDTYSPYTEANQIVIPPHSTGAADLIDFYPKQIPPKMLELQAEDAQRYYWLRVKK